MNDLIDMIQQDPELWEIVEQLKHQDDTLEDFLLNVANMLAVEFEEMHTTDLADKLSALFGGLPQAAFAMVPLLVHVALDIFLLKAIPNHQSIRD
jgi:hypothetical protein